MRLRLVHRIADLWTRNVHFNRLEGWNVAEQKGTCSLQTHDDLKSEVEGISHRKDPPYHYKAC